MAFTKSNGITVHYEVYGEGEPLILISGLGGDLTFWYTNVEYLAKKNKVIIYDTRGAGQTDATEEAYSMEIFAEDLSGLMWALGISKAHILGFSMGGNIALTFAHLYPEKVDKLIIGASFAVVNPQARLFLDAVLSVYEAGSTAKQMFDLIAPWLFSSDFLTRDENSVYLEYPENDPNEQPFYAWKNQYMAMRNYDIRKYLPNISAQTLIIAAAKDRLAHLEDAQLIACLLPNSHINVLPNSGHLLNIERPEEFQQMVNKYLSS